MIYIEETVKILDFLMKNNNKSSQYDIIKESQLKEKEVKIILSYMLQISYIDFDIQNNVVVVTKLGEAYVKAFGSFKKDTLKMLLNLRDNFPKALTKKDANPGLSSIDYRDVVWLLREKNYIEPISNVPVHELLRITEFGFQLLDLFEYKAKLESVLD